MTARNMARALRRHHAARMKTKWLARMKARKPQLDPATLARCVGMRAGTARLCSCCMCGNPRRYFGEPTVQERRALGRGAGKPASSPET